MSNTIHLDAEIEIRNRKYYMNASTSDFYCEYPEGSEVGKIDIDLCDMETDKPLDLKDLTADEALYVYDFAQDRILNYLNNARAEIEHPYR